MPVKQILPKARYHFIAPVGSFRILEGQCRLKDLDISSSVTSTDGSHLLYIAESYFTPIDIWTLDSPVGRIVRQVAYGSPELAVPRRDYSALSPNIAHVIWSNDDPVNFLFYLCVLSLLQVAKMDTVYIHGDGPPSGFYWNLIRGDPRLRLVRRTLIDRSYEKVFGNDVRNIQHMTDVWRVNIMCRYGGVYVDADAIFVKPLTHELRSYDAVIAKDLSPKTPFPAIYQNAILVGRPRAAFWRLLLESMKVCF